ncbi:Phosphoribosyltransferase domain-containing protein [Flavobacterium longum]|uniref:ComF family protein n=1 Tax=Flavobacterium longum TaxID=1299340 RepID=UPI0039E92652
MIRDFIDLFYPKVCAGCDRFLLASEYVICTRCRHEIPLTNHHLNRKNEAFQKFYGKLPVEYAGAMVWFHKKGIVQEMIHKLKYKGQQDIGNAIGYWYAPYLSNLRQTVDAIIPVPLHPKKQRQRGYNQVETFGKALSETLNIAYNDRLLVRNTYANSQTKKNRSDRADNSQSVFDISGIPEETGQHYLIVDDVLTTGATLEACGRALLKIPQTRLSIACIAMTE